MKRFERIASLLIVGFLAFAPLGTLIFGVPFLLGLGGYLLNRVQSIEHDPQPQPAASSSSNKAERELPVMERPRTFSELPAYLELCPPKCQLSVLPGKVKGGIACHPYCLTLAMPIAPRSKVKC